MADRGLLNENHCSLPLLSKVKFSAIRNSNFFFIQMYIINIFAYVSLSFKFAKYSYSCGSVALADSQSEVRHFNLHLS